MLRVVGLIVIACPLLVFGQDTTGRNILKWTDTDQVSWINATLAKGLPVDLGDALATLVLNKSSLTLPLIEKKIEDVLKSGTPLECFNDKSVDPQRFVDIASATIAYAGNEQALREIGKLIKIDATRFGGLIEMTLIHAENVRQNPFLVAYSGFKIGDPAIDQRIVAWADSQLAAAKTEFRANQLGHLWAEAMLVTYGGTPTEREWNSDLIASRISSSLAKSAHDDVIRFVIEAIEKRGRVNRPRVSPRPAAPRAE